MIKFKWLLSVIILLQFNLIIHAQTDNSKILVVYFSVPETDDVDASTGASRVIVDEKLYGTTEYVAKQIAEITKGNICEIKTVHAYPDKNHKDLINYAKNEAETKIYPEIQSKITNFDDYNIIFVGYPNW